MKALTRQRMRVAARLVTAAICTTLTACGATCGNEAITEVKSPGGSLRAVAFSRNCGATTGFNTQISIIRTGEPAPDGAGNVFIVEGAVPLKMRWHSDTELVISGTLGSKAFRQETLVSGVVIHYQ